VRGNNRAGDIKGSVSAYAEANDLSGSNFMIISV
jgi:hypothetical protein